MLSSCYNFNCISPAYSHLYTHNNLLIMNACCTSHHTSHHTSHTPTLHHLISTHNLTQTTRNHWLTKALLEINTTFLSLYLHWAINHGNSIYYRNVLLFCFVLQQIFQILSIVSIEKLQLKFYFYTAFYVPSSGSASYIFVTRFLLQSNCCTCIAAGNCIFCCTSSPSMSEDTVVR